MIVARAEFEKVREVQAMLLGTEAGRLLLRGIVGKGRIGQEIRTEQERIEHNFAQHILESAAIVLVPQPAPLEPSDGNEENVIDHTIMSGEPLDV